jgi:3-oxoadipate enol-lactonase/4-carboxymuconolactone decarboxylase
VPFATHAGARLYWRVDGQSSRPPLLLLNSIGTDMGSWDRALPYLLPRARVVRMDARGHGASDAPVGEYTLELLAGDAAAVLDAAQIGAATVCGVSLGGAIAMRLALDAPERVVGLIPACASPRMDAEAWRARIAAVRSGGTAAIADAAMVRYFSPAFLATNADITEGVRSALIAQSVEGYVGCAAALRDMDLVATLGGVRAPTLVIGATLDVSTPFPDHGRRIVESIPGARAAILEGSHLAQVEQPAAFAAAVVEFMCAMDGGKATETAADLLYETGLINRRKVLGDAWVDQSLAERTPFNADFQAMITRIAWGEIWGRPGLDHRTRRLLVLAITAALGRWEEFRLHVRAGLEQGGFTEIELKETLMQTAIYAGVPAANTAFAEAGSVIANLRRASSGPD